MSDSEREPDSSAAPSTNIDAPQDAPIQADSAEVENPQPDQNGPDRFQRDSRDSHPRRRSRRGRNRSRGRRRDHQEHQGAEPSSGSREASPVSQDLSGRPRVGTRGGSDQTGVLNILVNTLDSEESRVAVVKGGKLEELYVTIASQTSYVGNIYKGRVVNVEPSIDAAFVDFGAARNGFLHASDVMPIYSTPGFKVTDLAHAKESPEGFDESLQPGEHESGEEAHADSSNGGGKPGKNMLERARHRERLPIQNLLKKGQEVVVQITKVGIGGKGPSLTTFISIPGRYLVLMPSLSRCGVSRKIMDERERRRLKKVIEELEIPRGMGFIVRTAGVDRNKKDLQRDLDYLMNLWEVFEKRLEASKPPQVMYEESDLVIKTMRDVFAPEINEVFVDSEPVYRRIMDFVSRIMPRYRDRIKPYTQSVPIFHAYGIESEMEKLFQRKISLPSGGSIVMDQTEALVAIDVNSGKYRREADLEETAYRTNLEAIPEVVRQIRLRDLGGVIVMDFIDMIEARHRREVERAFREAMKNDRARVKIARISIFGILEMTRQRMGPGLKRVFFNPCIHCDGMGVVKTPEAMSLAVLREVQAAMVRRGFSTVEVTVHPDVEHYLSNVKRHALLSLEEGFQKNIILIGDPKSREGEYKLRFLASDGHEVRIP